MATISHCLHQLGQDLALARRRRRMTQASMAERAQISLPTLKRLEAGQETVNLGALMRVMAVLGLQAQLAGVASAQNDTTGMAIVNASLPGKGLRVYKKRKDPSDPLPFEQGAL